MHTKRNNKETKTYVQGLRPFIKSLPRNVKNILKKNTNNYSEIVNNWNILVEKEVAKSSYPKSIKINKNNMEATLVLSVKRGNEILIEYSKKEIINKINSFFGYRFINDIRLESINSEIKKNKNQINQFSKKFEEKIKKIKNKNIQKSLLKLMSATKK